VTSNRNFDKELEENYATLIYKDTFSDIGDPNETMKTFINGRTFVQLEDKRTKHFEMFLQKGNVAKEFFLRDDSTETFSVGSIREHDQK
jgi:hypothetical protein